MPYRPLASLALQVLTHAYGLIGLRPSAAVLTALMLITAVGSVLCYLRQYGGGRLLAALSVACWVVLHLHIPDSHPNVVGHRFPARIHGTVVSGVQTADTVRTIIISGETDTKPAPPTVCTTIVYLRKPVIGDIPKGARVLCFGMVELPQEPGLPSLFSSIDYAGRVGAAFVARADSAFVLQQPDVVQLSIQRIHSLCYKHISRYCTPYATAVLMAMLLGQPQYLSKEQKHQFIVVGTIHVLVVSGAHVVMLAALLIALSGGRIRGIVHAIIVVVCLAAYVMITGFQPPALRAFTVITVFIIGAVIQRIPDATNILGFAVIIQILISPQVITGSSLLFSVIATFSIIKLLPAWVRCWERCLRVNKSWIRHFVNALSLNLATTTGMLFPVAYTMKTVAWFGIIANLVTVPVLTFVMVCGLLLCTIGLFSDVISLSVAWCINTMILFIVWFNTTIADISVPVSYVAATLVALSGTAGLLWLLRSQNRRHLTYRIVLMTIAVFGVYYAFSPRHPLVSVGRDRDRILVEVSAGDRTQRISIQGRYGNIFVRSLHGDNLGNQNNTLSMRNYTN
ncbi:MAG: ComEC/Rec2 family competence protein [Flavobacteriales bacterium]|nr:ComEC/Rec2 family competence protein [Flavobacteriales bacterium]